MDLLNGNFSGRCRCGHACRPVTLVDGRISCNYSRDWMFECLAADVNTRPSYARSAWLQNYAKRHGEARRGELERVMGALRRRFQPQERRQPAAPIRRFA